MHQRSNTSGSRVALPGAGPLAPPPAIAAAPMARISPLSGSGSPGRAPGTRMRTEGADAALASTLGRRTPPCPSATPFAGSGGGWT
ncbi:hypothetical protein JMG10_35090 [Nostoc ellipsosporum NOK]|nr:hypothetical protein [Nostoc ellipsosporum NOK]